MANSKNAKASTSSAKKSAPAKAATPTKKAVPAKKATETPKKSAPKKAATPKDQAKAAEDTTPDPARAPIKRGDPDYRKRPVSKGRKADLTPKHVSGEPIDLEKSFKAPDGQPAILSEEDTGAGTGDEFVNQTQFDEEAPEANPPSHLTDAPLKGQQNVGFDRWYSELRHVAQAEYNFTLKEIGEFDSDKFKPYYESGDPVRNALKKEREKLDNWQKEE